MNKKQGIKIYQDISYVEYGADNSKVIVMLHGGGMSWWNYKTIAEKLEKNYRVILPMLDGHGDSKVQYVSIEENAKKLTSFIQGLLGEPVFLICGFSLGAQTLVEILSQKSVLCQNAIIESALLIPMPVSTRFTKLFIPFVYPLIKKEWFSRYQFTSYHVPEGFYDDYYRDSNKITKSSLKNMIHANGTYHLKPSFSATSANIIIVVGEKELSKIIKSAKLLHDVVKDSKLMIIKGLYHGGFCMKKADEYKAIIDGFGRI